jgi:serum/glucocorticoid-regulated kinase 2
VRSGAEAYASAVRSDLKPENVLVDADGHVKLCDFGLSKFLVSVPAGGAEAAGSSTPPTIPRTFTFCGTPEYLAPEVLTGEGYDFAVDYWCLGCLVFEMLTGLPPYYSQNIEEMYRWILEHQSPRFPPEMSAEARSLIEGLLNPDREARLGCGGDDGYRRLQSHVFFKKINWKRAAERALKPPFVPEMSSPLDVSNFDTGFTSEPAVDSVVERQLDYTVVFESFSYASSAMNETIA